MLFRSFLSGQAADSFGVPAVNGAKTLIEAFNNGKAPAPYNKKGFGGLNIVPVYVDENGGATKQVTELRNMYDREGVDMVIGPGTEIIAGEGMIVTAGAIDTHIHFIAPQQIDEALVSGVTTMIGGGTGPATGTFATTCTPGPWHKIGRAHV